MERDDTAGALRPRLDEVEEKLAENLSDVCGERSVHALNTGELIRVEETLTIAAEAAKEAVSLRRKLREDTNEAYRNSDAARRESPAGGTPEPPGLG